MAKIFTRGSRHRWRNEISGQFAGSPFAAFEYLYSVSQGRGSTTIKLAMIHWQIPGQVFPSFALAPETAVSQFKEFFGAQDIDFADDPVFSRFYVLNGTDEAAVRRLFTPSVRHALALERWHRVAGAGTDLFWWQECGLPPPEAVDAFLSEGDAVRRIFAGPS